MLGVAMLAAPAAAQNSNCASPAGKCFAVTVSPLTPAQGGTVSFTFTVTNEASTQQIGSFQITAPTPFVVTDASVPSPGSVSHTSSSALFTNLSVAPSASITVIVTALLPCSGSSYQWTMQVKQSNDFSGLPGNNFQLDPASAGNLSGTPSPQSCSLGFTSDGQPTGTVVSPAVITSGFGSSSSGGPVKVAVLDGSGQPITNPAAIGGPVTVTVTITPGSNPGPGNLLGTTTAQTSGGVASFSDLSIDRSGEGYRLTATPAAIPGQVISASDPSNYFTIFGSLKQCQASGAPCSASLSSATTTGTVTTSSVTSPGSLLGAGIGGADYSCATYQSFSDPFSFDVFSPSGAQEGAQFSASIDISKSTVKSSGRNQAAAWQLCYASTTDFSGNAVEGTYTAASDPGAAVIGGVPFNTGLLLACSATQGVPPCLQSRAKVNGDVVITFLASGDPVGRG